jgi:hypothetical protein
MIDGTLPRLRDLSAMAADRINCALADNLAETNIRGCAVKPSQCGALASLKLTP